MKKIFSIICVIIVILGLVSSIGVVLGSTGVLIKLIAGYEIIHWSIPLIDTIFLNLMALSSIILFVNFIKRTVNI